MLCKNKLIINTVYYRELLKCFTTTEIIHWKQLCNTYESELKFGSTNGPATHVFNTKLEGGAKRWTDLKNRVVEHVSILQIIYGACFKENSFSGTFWKNS